MGGSALETPARAARSPEARLEICSDIGTHRGTWRRSGATCAHPREAPTAPHRRPHKNLRPRRRTSTKSELDAPTSWQLSERPSRLRGRSPVTLRGTRSAKKDATPGGQFRAAFDSSGNSDVCVCDFRKRLSEHPERSDLVGPRRRGRCSPRPVPKIPALAAGVGLAQRDVSGPRSRPGADDGPHRSLAVVGRSSVVGGRRPWGLRWVASKMGASEIWFSSWGRGYSCVATKRGCDMAPLARNAFPPPF